MYSPQVVQLLRPLNQQPSHPLGEGEVGQCDTGRVGGILLGVWAWCLAGQVPFCDEVMLRTTGGQCEYVKLATALVVWSSTSFLFPRIDSV
jgi:hypothetical protein